MVFGDFFRKLNEDADADLENVIYYKASFHNYIILTPKRQNLIKHGLSGKVYHFAAARGAHDNSQDMEKQKLKTYVKAVLKVAGIPIDEALSNGGFVEPPNDCMAFDFAECWNTPKSIVFSLPPPDYQVDEHGPWVGEPLVPIVALAGDALLEPFWPLGLGLKRGWQAVMDTCYAVDNIYNRTLLCERLGQHPAMFSWDDHYEALSNQLKDNFQSCAKVEVADDLGKGEYSTDSLVMIQWKKYAGEWEKPPFLVEIDPDTRYKKRNLQLNSAQKRTMLEDKEWRHPTVRKYLAIREYTEEVKKHPENNGWKKLISIDGKSVVKARSDYVFKAPAAAPAKPVAVPTAEIEMKSAQKRDSLMRSVTEMQLEQHMTSTSKRRQSQIAGATAGLLAQLKHKGAGSTEEDLHKISHEAPASDSLAERSEAMWDRMLDRGLSPAQTAELAHYREMIVAMERSIAAFRQVERAILMGSAGSA
jgi:hypothetical protein